VVDLNETDAELFKASYRRIAEVVHLNGWDHLDCPFCFPDIWYRNIDRVEQPLVGAFGVWE
jgi:hypothetical protein